MSSIERRRDLVTLRRGHSDPSLASRKVPAKAPAPRSATRIALVTMPFASRYHPSIQVGLLTSIGRAKGFTVDSFHLNLDLAKQLGSRVYEALCELRGCASGEWLFAAEAFGDAAPTDEDAFFQANANRLAPILEQAKIDRARYVELRRQEIPRYLDDLMAMVPWGEYDVVGFSSTFEQNIASFALAARIKRAHPHVVTLFGGANFDGEMGHELVRAVHAIDYAVVGEGDEAFPDFLEAIHEGHDPGQVPGVIHRNDDGTVDPPIARAPFTDLDSLPTPVYDEYFARSESLRLSMREGRGDFQIPFESSRGCWWGEKHHCTFCGLNAKSMKFRAKSPARVRSELDELASKTESFRFQAVDNIVETSYFDTLFPELKKSRADYTLFYEIKSNLTRAQIKMLADAGVRVIQPGIESLSTHVLGLMRKGVKAIQQVNTLRWAQYYGIRAEWNVLWGFPGEDERDCLDQIELIARVRHLHPPRSHNRFWMERFSPVYFDEEFRKRFTQPEKSYEHVYPSAGVDLQRIAYFFDYQLEGTMPDEAFLDLARVLTRWRDSWTKDLRRPTMFYWASPSLVRIEDRREPGSPETILLRGLEAAVYAACSDAPRSIEAVLDHLRGGDQALTASAADVRQVLASFDERHLVMREGDRFLSLAIPAVDGR